MSRTLIVTLLSIGLHFFSGQANANSEEAARTAMAEWLNAAKISDWKKMVSFDPIDMARN